MTHVHVIGPRVTPRHGSLVAALEQAAAGDAELFTFHLRERSRLTARRLLDDARRWGAALQAEGVRRGDPVPILLPTSPELVGALLGAMWIGALPAPLASPMTFGSLDRFMSSLAFVLDDSRARVVVASGRIREALQRVRPEHLEAVLGPEDATTSKRAPATSIDPQQGALLQYTSGTTGKPKGVLISHRALIANAFAIHEGLGLTPSDVGVSWLPMFHDMGLIGVLCTAIAHPYPVHLLRPDSFVLRPERWLTLIGEVGGTVSAAPNFAYQLCVSRARDVDARLETWRLALNGSEQVHRTTVERFCTRFEPNGFHPSATLPVYGMAENTLAVTLPRVAGSRFLQIDRAALSNEGRARESSNEPYDAVSLGSPVAGTELRVRRDGVLVGEGRVGEIELAGSSVMDGYYRNPAATEEVLRDGWLRTGDLGFVRDGELFVVGRCKDVVIKAGRNVYPADVERVASDHPDAFASAAFGVPDADGGTDRLVLMVETRVRDLDARASIERAVRGEILASLSVKVDELGFAAIGSLPRTTSGKLQRARCAAQFVSERSSR